MKIILSILAVVMSIGVVAVILWLRRTPAKHARGIGPAHRADPIDFQREMRERLLAGCMADFGIDAGVTQNGTWGVIMESSYSEGTATLVCLCDGTASLYLGCGGGIIGGQAHEAVRVAAARFLALASDHVQSMVSAEAHPMPDVGQVRFYAMTRSGVFTAEEDEQRLGGGNHELSPVFYAGHEVITELRRATE